MKIMNSWPNTYIKLWFSVYMCGETTVKEPTGSGFESLYNSLFIAFSEYCTVISQKRKNTRFFPTEFRNFAITTFFPWKLYIFEPNWNKSLVFKNVFGKTFDFLFFLEKMRKKCQSFFKKLNNEKNWTSLLFDISFFHYSSWPGTKTNKIESFFQKAKSFVILPFWKEQWTKILKDNGTHFFPNLQG